MDQQRRIAGVDYGTKRIGIALADPLRIFARPYGTFDPNHAVDELRRIHRDEGLETIVVGWPLLADGSEGRMTARVQEFVNRLRNALPGIEIVVWDERYTSQMAANLMSEAYPTKRLRKDQGDLDAAAAAVILQDYLER